MNVRYLPNVSLLRRIHLFILPILLYVRFMRIVLQKVASASVSVDGKVIGAIEAGYVLFVGVLKGDTEEQAQKLAEKVVKLRLFDGEDGKINDRSVLDRGGSTLIISQFTLAGDTKKGNRPDYTAAESPDTAKVVYERFIDYVRNAGVERVETGVFGAHMEVSLVNDGPVTLILES